MPLKCITSEKNIQDESGESEGSSNCGEDIISLVWGPKMSSSVPVYMQPFFIRD